MGIWIYTILIDSCVLSDKDRNNTPDLVIEQIQNFMLNRK
jgi:hypothetical protein